jgi:hypothetical protein
MFPICPSVCKFSVKSGVETFKNIWKQLAVVPEFAFRDYKAQG